MPTFKLSAKKWVAPTRPLTTPPVIESQRSSGGSFNSKRMLQERIRREVERYTQEFPDFAVSDIHSFIAQKYGLPVFYTESNNPYDSILDRRPRPEKIPFFSPNHPFFADEGMGGYDMDENFAPYPHHIPSLPRRRRSPINRTAFSSFETGYFGNSAFDEDYMPPMGPFIRPDSVHERRGIGRSLSSRPEEFSQPLRNIPQRPLSRACPRSPLPLHHTFRENARSYHSLPHPRASSPHPYRAPSPMPFREPSSIPRRGSAPPLSGKQGLHGSQIRRPSTSMGLPPRPSSSIGLPPRPAPLSRSPNRRMEPDMMDDDYPPEMLVHMNASSSSRSLR